MLKKIKQESQSNFLKNEPIKEIVKTPVQLTWVWLRKSLFSLSKKEATFEKRGFYTSDLKIQQHLEKIGCTFLEGYQAVIADENPAIFLGKLNAIDNELRGFAFEGAAMALALLDRLTPWRSDRLETFLTGAGSNHIYMSYVGAGWALARLPWTLQPYLAQLSSSPLLAWLAIDGYGFHQGYFKGLKYIQTLTIPTELSGYALKVFDQGLGRSLWFVEGADINRIAHRIEKFQPLRRGDLWSGVGLACTYAGGVDRFSIERLKTVGKDYLPQIAQGAAFAAKTRQRAENLTKHTEISCQVLCGMSAQQAATITDETLIGLSEKGKTPVYEIWRQRIQSHFLTSEVVS